MRGEGGVTFSKPACLPPPSKRIDEAADRLRQAGVPDFHFEWEAAIVEAKAGQQNEHTQAIHEARHSGLLDSLPAEAAADVRSGGGPGAGSFMDLPDESAIRLDDYRLRTCLRARLLLPHPAHDPTRASAPTTHCQHRNASSGVTCGRPLDASGQHAETCGEGGATVRGHNAVRDALAAFLVASGSPAEIEQHVPAWDRPERDLRGNTKVDSAGHTVYDRAWTYRSTNEAQDVGRTQMWSSAVLRPLMPLTDSSVPRWTGERPGRAQHVNGLAIRRQQTRVKA